MGVGIVGVDLIPASLRANCCLNGETVNFVALAYLNSTSPFVAISHSFRWSNMFVLQKRTNLFCQIQYLSNIYQVNKVFYE